MKAASYNFLFPLLVLLVAGCNSDGIEDKNKRNENWAWWIDVRTGKGEWRQVKMGLFNSEEDNGRYTLFYFNGSIREVGKIKNGKQVDTIYSYDLNGELAAYGFMVQDSLSSWYILKNGPCKVYYPNGKLEADELVQNHTIIDKMTTYYENGKKKMIHDFVRDTGWIVEYYETGLLKDSMYHVKGLGNFTIKSWYENGNPFEVMSYEKGGYNGIGKTYYENGRIKDSSEFVNGNIEGADYMWYENGQIQQIGFRKDHKFEGHVIYYFENGKIKYEANFKNGLFDGEQKKYDENGNLVSLLIYKDGVKIK